MSKRVSERVSEWASEWLTDPVLQRHLSVITQSDLVGYLHSFIWLNLNWTKSRLKFEAVTKSVYHGHIRGCAYVHACVRAVCVHTDRRTDKLTYLPLAAKHGMPLVCKKQLNSKRFLFPLPLHKCIMYLSHYVYSITSLNRPYTDCELVSVHLGRWSIYRIFKTKIGTNPGNFNVG